jgi:hypothetical protein
MSCTGYPHICAHCGGELSAASWGRYRPLDMDGSLHDCYSGPPPAANERWFSEHGMKQRKPAPLGRKRVARQQTEPRRIL